MAPFQTESATAATIAPTRNNEMPLQSGDMLSRTVLTSPAPANICGSMIFARAVRIQYGISIQT